MPLIECFLAGADVHHQRQPQRQIGRPAEEPDLLRDAVFSHLDIVLRQVRRQRAALVAYDESNVDEADVDLDR